MIITLITRDNWETIKLTEDMESAVIQLNNQLVNFAEVININYFVNNREVQIWTRNHMYSIEASTFATLISKPIQHVNTTTNISVTNIHVAHIAHIGIN